ncbi:MAG: neutral zinc metallopeptidase [Propionibacteriaceae bacterium]|nr:neutral zinc metallopeptidase [Propionibacteriaceae bacterium]
MSQFPGQQHAPNPGGQPGQPPGPMGAPRHQPTMPAPKPRRGAGPVILAALGVLALGMIGLIIYSLLGGPDYQNDDYQPPPPGQVVPLPDIRVDEVDAILSDNALYAQQLPVPIRCELRNPEIDVMTAEDGAVKDHIDDVMGCAMRVWDQPFRGTERFELVRPAVNIYHDTVVSPCGGGQRSGPNASYCAANQEVYFSRQLAAAHPGFAIIDERRALDVVMAHEFAHGMQARNGALLAEGYKSRRADEQTALENSRRIELQADCYAGMYVQAIHESIDLDDAEMANMTQAMRAVGDDEIAGRPGDPAVVGNHGHAENRVYWFQIGLTSTEIGRCNTFTVAPEHVR